MSVDETPSTFMTVGEVARLLRVSTMTVYRMVRDGELRAFKTRHTVRVYRSSVDEMTGRDTP